MNNQKNFILIAIALTVFLLSNKWQITHQVDANSNMVSQTQIIDTTTNNSSAKQDLDVPKFNNQIDLNAPSVETDNQDSFITITTDLLTLQISRKGGTIQKAFLNQYPAALDGIDKFQLFNNTPGSTFQAQSGLASPNNILPTHLSVFNSKQSDYQLIEDTLIVPLTWKKDNIEVIKKFHFKKGSYLIKVDYDIKNNSNQTIPVKSYTRLERSDVDHSSLIMPTVTGGVIYNTETLSVQKKSFDEWDEFHTGEEAKFVGGWMAMIQQYFAAVWIPNQQEKQKYYATSVNNLYKLTDENTQVNLRPNTTTTITDNQLYIGPKEYGKIEQIATGLHYTLDYGWLDILADPLSWVIHKINNYVNNWGWSIILLTVLIKLIFYPLSEKSYRSMAGMRKLSPRLAKLKETYGDNKQKMGRKTMELYKQEKINPAAGCLPILIQMPVFIALYWMLLDTVELRQATFGYLPDLSAMDPYYILPVIMGISMFVQQKLNPPPPDPMQAKIMMTLPLVFTIMFVWFPSGLVLYWVVNNVLSIAQQWVINKRIGT